MTKPYGQRVEERVHTDVGNCVCKRCLDASFTSTHEEFAETAAAEAAAVDHAEAGARSAAWLRGLR